MPKTARLDQILLQLGYVHVDEIARALQRQRVHGGRLGMNLVQLGAITEEQLLAALAEQFRMPTLTPREGDIPVELVERMPPEVVAEGLVVPLAWNESQRVLSVAAANPGDEAVLKQVRDAFGARGMRVGIAPEGLLAALGRRLVPEARQPQQQGKVALPELFAEETDAADADVVAEGRRETVVMLTSSASRKDFLPPVFEREGVSLTVALDRTTLERGLQERPSRVLISAEMAGTFADWRSQGLSLGEAEVVHFSSVSQSLTENPLPYQNTVGSLKAALRALADYRSAELGVSPPHGLIASDVTALAAEIGLGRVPMDGLDLCVHLLLPPRRTDSGPGSAEPFAAFASSLELASRLRFPWPLDKVLVTSHTIYTDGHESLAEQDPEVAFAAQLLCLVWFRHHHVRPEGNSDEDRLLDLRTRLRSEGGRFASREIVEAYIRVVAARGAFEDDLSDRQVLLVGGDRLPRVLSPALARLGRETVESNELVDAQALVQRRAPAAIVLEHDSFPDGLDRFIRVTKLGEQVLVFVLTDASDPALVLNLLDVGADDVFGPPHDFDLMAARVNRAIRSRRHLPSSGSSDAGQFSASFEVFSFLDLIQMLSQGMKSVRIDLKRGEEQAVLLMSRGRIVHATLGGISGENAVYQVIAWEDEGSFTVREAHDFPTPTIQGSTESVLMEGLRKLDESKR